MARYRIQRRTGIGEDILDTGPMEESIAALQAEDAAIAARLAALENKPTAKVAVSSGGGSGDGGVWTMGRRLPDDGEVIELGRRI